MKIERVFRSTSVDKSRLVDTETGEMVEGSGSIRVYDVEATELRVIKLNNFVTFPSDKIISLSLKLSHSDLGKILIMSEMCKTAWNILYSGNNRPHSTSSLASSLGMRRVNSIYPVLDRLLSANVLATRLANVNGVRSRIFYMNPYITKRRRTVHHKLIEMFDRGDNSRMAGRAEDEYVDLDFHDIEVNIDETLD